MKRFLLLPILALALTPAGSATAHGQFGSAVRLVSVPDPAMAPTPATTGNAASDTPRFSRDGRFLVFASAASNLVTNDFNGGHSDIFVRELATGRTTLVSVTPAGVSGDGDSVAPTISADGRRVAFLSRATDLVPGDTNRVADVFVRDLVEGTTRRVSVATDGTAANGECFAPCLTPDGRAVGFGSRAANLDAGRPDSDGRIDFFVRDLESGETRLASAETRPGTASDVSEYALSDDGEWVAFVTLSTNVVAPAPTGIPTTGFVRNLRTDAVHPLVINPALVTPFRGTLDIRAMAFAPGRPRLAISAWLGTSTAGLTNVVQIVDLGGTGPTVVMAVAGAHGNRADDPAPLEFAADGEALAFAQPVVSTEPAALRWWRNDAGITTPTHPTTGRRYRARELAIDPEGRRVAFVAAAGESTPPAALPAVFHLYVLETAGGEPRLVTATPEGTPAEGTTEYGHPTFASDGRRLAFQSGAGRLVAGDRNGVDDVFVYDVESRAMQVASVPAAESATAGGGGSLLVRGLSATGRHVLFSSLSDDLVPDDAKGVPDLFVRDLATGRTVLVTVPGESGGPTRPGFGEAVLSANGRFVAFTADLRIGQAPHSPQVFVRDLALGRTRVVGLTPGGQPAVMRTVVQLRISADGRYVAFFSDATTLAPGSTARGQAILRDLETGRNWLVDTPDVTSLTTTPAHALTLSGLGGKVLVSRAAAVPVRVTVLDPVAETREEIGVPLRSVATLGYDGRRLIVVSPGTDVGSRPLIRWRDGVEVAWHGHIPATESGLEHSIEALSRDGRWLALRQRALVPGVERLSTLVLDLETGAATGLEVSPEGSWSGRPVSRFASLSADGRVAAFESDSADLEAGDPNAVSDIFVRNLATGRTTRVPRSPDGPWEPLGASRPLLGADGRRVVFDSWSAGFVGADGNGAVDVFAVDLTPLPPGDSDQDGLEDLWELTWFGNLLRDGLGDFDGDGASERNEQAAGTCPIDDLSRFRVTVGHGTGGILELVWGTEPGRRYRIDSADELGGAWSHSVRVFEGTGGEMRFALADDAAAGNGARFYRVEVESGL